MASSATSGLWFGGPRLRRSESTSQHVGGPIVRAAMPHNYFGLISFCRATGFIVPKLEPVA